MRTNKSFSLVSVLLVCFISTAAPLTVMGEENSVLRMFGISSGNDSPEMQNGLSEVNALITFSCEEVYPKPTVAECIDRVKHGIGASFDPHSQFMNKEEVKRFNEDTQGSFGGLGIEISKTNSTSLLTIMNVMEDTPSHRAGLLAGDIISHIIPDGRSSIPAVSLKDANEAVKLLRGTPNTKVSLKVLRKGVDQPLAFTIVREIITTIQIKGELLIDGTNIYALIENKMFNRGNRAAMRAKYVELEKQAGKAGGKLSGLILSFENNPGGLLHEAYNDIDLFLDAPTTVLIRGNNGIEAYVPVGMQLVRTNGDITNGLPILAVVNKGSASASEVFTAAMKHFGRATIAGTSRTYGKGIVQAIHSASGSAAIKLTSSEYLIGSVNDWIPVQCVGIEPDIIFEYPGIKNPERATECELSGHVGTIGPMKNAPMRPSIRETNPAHYAVGAEMLEVYKTHKLPKLLAEQERRKLLEKTE